MQSSQINTEILISIQEKVIGYTTKFRIDLGEFRPKQIYFY